ncbi:MAG TPA: response regulator transcription factor [Chloroflexota bacterium]
MLRDREKAKIVAADDDPHMLRLVQRSLEAAGYQVLTANNGRVALDLVASENPDLLILDLRMPVLDGWEVCRRVREFSAVPIIMLTQLNDELDRVRGLDTGADDYLGKPFGTKELVARVRAALRRAQDYNQERTQSVVTSGDLVVDFTQHQVTLRGRVVDLTPTEYRLLAHLARNAGRVLTQSDILTRVWGPAYEGESHLLRVNIARLRQKIEDDPSHPKRIITRQGIGYLLVADGASEP